MADPRPAAAAAQTMAVQTPAGHPMRALEPLAGHYASGPGVALSPIGARAHVSLRAHPDAVAKVAKAVKIALPERAKTSATAGALSAFWLGPEDWLLVAEAGGAPKLIAAVEKSGAKDHSAVDVSDRYVGIALEGFAAEAVLSAGCPQDLRLRSFPVGAVSRTILAKADVILWRRSETDFELLCVRSFADYVWAFLVEAARAPAV